MSPENGATLGTCSRDESQDKRSTRKKRTPNSGPPSRSRWRTLERVTARKLRGRRLAPGDFFGRSTDILVDDFYLVVEVKSDGNFARDTIMGLVRHEYAWHGETPCLVTQDGQAGDFATIPLGWFTALLDEVRIAREGRQ